MKNSLITLLLILLLLSSFSFVLAREYIGEKYIIPDLEVDRSLGRYYCRGHVIKKSTGMPLRDGYVYLGDKYSREIVAEARTDEEGYFEVEAEDGEYGLLISPAPIKTRVGEVSEIKVVEKLDKLIKEKLPHECYGRKNLILNPKAEITIGKHTTNLNLIRNVNLDMPTKYKSFDSVEASCLMYQHAKKMPEFESAKLGLIKVPYTLDNGQKDKLTHPVMQLVLKTGKKEATFFVDASPLTEGNIMIGLQPEFLDLSQKKAKEALEKAKYEVVLSPSVPIEFVNNMYVLGGLQPGNNRIYLNFMIIRIKYLGKSHELPYEVTKSYKLQVMVPRYFWRAFRKQVLKQKPDNFLENLPPLAKKATAGTLDNEMKEVFLSNKTTLFEMIKKSEIEEADILAKCTKVEQEVLKSTAYGRRIKSFIDKNKTPVFYGYSRSGQAQYVFTKDVIIYNPLLQEDPEKWKTELEVGHPLHQILRFHEELHRAQEKLSKWESFLAFLRESGQIDKIFTGEKSSKTTDLYLPDDITLSLCYKMTGVKTDELDKARKLIWKAGRVYHNSFPERELLKEIHAYWASDVLSVDVLYNQLYVKHHVTYHDVEKVSKEKLEELCNLIDKLYGRYDGDHYAVAKIVGNSDSIEDFEKKAKKAIGEIDKAKLSANCQRYLKEKEDWQSETKRIAKAYFQKE